MKTAVEWLIDMLVTENEITLKGENYKLFDQAKAMEKEQIIDAYEEQNVKWDPEFFEDGTMAITNKFRNAEEYYNETFKTN